MKKGIGKVLKRVLVFTLCIAMALQYYHISGANNEATITLTKKYDEKSNTVIIDAKASCLAGYEITGIQMTGQERKTGTSLQVTVSENKDYVFTVFYRAKAVEEKEKVDTTVSTNTPIAPNPQEKVVESTPDATSTKQEGKVAQNLTGTSAVENKVVEEKNAAIPVTESKAVEEKGIDTPVTENKSQNDVSTSTPLPSQKEQKQETVTSSNVEVMEELSKNVSIKVTEIQDVSKQVRLAATSDDFLFNPTTQTITGYNGAITGQKDIIIPDMIDNKKVLHIGNQAFAGQQVKTLSFNCTALQSIGDQAFYNNQITEVTLPDSVESIGVEAFVLCSSLKTLHFPASLKTIGKKAFSNLGIADIDLPEGLETIEANAFESNGAIVNVTIPASVKTIGSSVFESSSLKSVTFLGSIDKLEDSVFSWCGNLEKVTFNGKVRKFGNDVFSRCGNLKEISLPEGLEEMGQAVFLETGLTDLIIPSSVTSIKFSIVNGCANIKNITIEGSGAISINENAFTNPNIKNIKINGRTSDSVTGAPWGADYASIEWKENTQEPAVITVEPYVYNRNTSSIIQYNGTDTNLHIPGQISYKGVQYPVVSIAEYTFSGKQTLVTVTMDNTIKNLKSDCFANCKSLESATLSSGLSFIDRSIFGGCTKLKNVVIPEGITGIGWEAFSYCESLQSITLPTTFNRIDDTAFNNCKALESITILGNASFNLSSYCFNLPNLKEINLPDRMKGSVGGNPWGAINATINWKDGSDAPAQLIIGDYEYNRITQTLTKYTGTETDIIVPAELKYNGNSYPVTTLGPGLYTNHKLKSVIISKGITTIGSSVFNVNPSLTSISIPDSVTTIGEYAFSDAFALKKIYIPNSVTSIGGTAFSNCRSLEEVHLPNALKGISSDLFNGCTSLKVLEIPDSITVISWGGFANCTSLETVILPRNLKGIGMYSFLNCTSLKQIKLPEGLENIDSVAFKGCTSLMTLDLPSSVTRIGDGILENCPLITTITIPSSVYGIGNNAFANCSGLETINIQTSRGSMDYTKYQPWGANTTTKVSYLGEYVYFQHDTSLNEQKGFDIDLSASILKGGVFINKIILPDTSTIRVGSQIWPSKGKYTYHVEAPGIYEFIGVDNRDIEYPYQVEVKAATIAYNSNSNQKAKTTGEITKQVVVGDKVTIASETELGFNKEKAIFQSWNTKADGTGNTYTPNEVVAIERDVTLYATWKAVNDGDVNFRIRPGDENLGSITATSYTGIVGEKLGANVPGASANWTCVFDGWYKGDEKVAAMEKEKIGDSAIYEARFILDRNRDGKDDRKEKYKVHFEIAEADKGKAILSTSIAEVGYDQFLGNQAASYNIDTETAPGVTFDGWYRDNRRVMNIANEKITEDRTYIAKFNGALSKYRVNFQIEEEDGTLNTTDVYTTQVLSSSDVLAVPTVQVKTDKKFLGWYKQGDASETLVADITKEPVDNITYIAKVADMYTVTYQIRQEDSALGSLEANKTSVKIQDGYTIGSEVPSVTEEQGASFLGWYKDSKLVSDMANEMITANTTYVAYFKLDRDGNGIDDRTQKYTYTCQIREADKEKAKLDGTLSGEVGYGTKMKALLPTVDIDTGISDGVNFLGWFKNDTKIDIETEVLTDNVIYEARFDGAITKARVNFEVDATLASLDGNVSILSKAYTLGQAIGKDNLPTVTLKNNKKKHVGWYKKGDSKQTIVDFDTETPDAKATYVAKILDLYTVTYTVRNGDETLGSISINSMEIVDGDTITTVPETPTKLDQAKCIGWYKDDGTKVDLTKEKITKDMTYEARFILDRDDNHKDDREQKYTYTFKVRDIDATKATLTGAKDGIVSGELLYGTNLKDKVPTVNIDLDITENVHFIGWYLNDKEITNFDTVKVTDNVVYEARFDGAITKARVYFEADASLATVDGGTKPVEKILPIKQAIGENALPTIHVLNSKKTHIGWYKKEDSKQTLVDFTTEMPTVDTTYVAKIVDVYTVNYLMKAEDVLLGSLSKQTDQVIAGDKISNLPETICNNHKVKFDGWYQDGKRVDLVNEVITKDSIYVAHFIVDADNDDIDDRTQDYMYTFQIRKEDAGKAKLEGTTVDTVAYGTSLKDKVPSYTIDKEVSEGVTFLGWYKEDQIVTNIENEKITGNVVYEARFSGKVTKTKVNFEVDDSIASIIGGNSNGEIIVNKDQAIGENTLPILDVKDEKKKHIGWYEKGDSNQTIIDFDKELPNPDVIYVPKIVDVYTVSFTVRKSDAKLGSIDKQSVEVITGDTITDVPKITVMHDNVQFIGWYCDGKKVKIEEERITKDTTYEARFEFINDESNELEEEVKVNFEVDETLASLVDGNINFEKIVKDGQVIGEDALPIIKLKDSKKRHIGWYKKGDSNQTLIDFSKEKPDPNVTYVAKIVDVFTVTYTVRSGDEQLGNISIYSSEVIDGSQLKVLPEITIANDQVEFLGWYYDGKKIALDKVRITEDRVFEARFQYKKGSRYDNTKETSHEKEKVKTGDNQDSNSVFAVMILSLLGIFFNRKKKKEVQE